MSKVGYHTIDDGDVDHDDDNNDHDGHDDDDEEEDDDDDDAGLWKIHDICSMANKKETIRNNAK